MDDTRQGPTLALLDEHVDVRGHHAPGQQVITVLIESLERARNNPGNSRLAERPAPEATVEIRFSLRQARFFRSSFYGPKGTRGQ